MKIDFSTFEDRVIRLAKKQKVGYLVPNNDYLYWYWKQGMSPEDVVKNYCTKEESLKRHNT